MTMGMWPRHRSDGSGPPINWGNVLAIAIAIAVVVLLVWAWRVFN